MASVAQPQVISPNTLPPSPSKPTLTPPTPPPKDEPAPKSKSEPRKTLFRSNTLFGKVKEVRIAVLGSTGAGKTTFINIASGSNLRVGIGLKSCTDQIETSQPFQLGSHMVTLVDTPGFDDTTKSDAEILDIVCKYLLSEYKQGRHLNGVIYLHRITDNRMSGSALRNFRFFEQLCGDEAIKNSAIVTNMWNMVDHQVAESREAELKSHPDFFKGAIDAGSQFLRHIDNTKESAHKVLGFLVRNKAVPLGIQRELWDQKKSIASTTAGGTLLGELADLTHKHEEEMRELEADLEEAKREQDEASQKELEDAKVALMKAREELQQERQRILESDVPTEEKKTLLKALAKNGRIVIRIVTLARPRKFLGKLLKRDKRRSNEDSNGGGSDGTSPKGSIEQSQRPEET